MTFAPLQGFIVTNPMIWRLSLPTSGFLLSIFLKDLVLLGRVAKPVERGEEQTLAHHRKSKVPTATQRGDCSIFTLKVIGFLFCGLPLDRITVANVPKYRLRMVINMLHRLHNVQCVVHDSNLWLTINFL
ncbi:hypothetical protein C1H46_031629 [Malus baccata]|uniref:Ubiquitin-like protease family profile domain-containing protein n=1 Tax=Malus baccata TaxID=106549 RepID=A0A540L908_MALBA|nr:hypothetical protein C1H46_031629 [Malus baccata]